jgi:quercetin dioxygenase-like cupin family protein
MKEIYSNGAYKVMRILLPAGKQMPLHYSSSDAFLIVNKGSADLSMGNSVIHLHPGTTQLIPAFTPHSLHITDDFNACIILENAGKIASGKVLSPKIT